MIEALSLAAGSCSLLLTALGYRRELSPVNEFEQLAKKLHEFSGGEDFEPDDIEKLILTLLENGSLIVGQIRQKFVVRALQIACVVGALMIATIVDLTQIAGPNAEAISNFAFLFAVLVVPLFLEVKLLNEREELFVKNLQAISDLYYEKFIEPVMDVINTYCDNEVIIKAQKNQLEIRSKRLSKRFEAAFEKAKLKSIDTVGKDDT